MKFSTVTISLMALVLTFNADPSLATSADTKRIFEDVFFVYNRMVPPPTEYETDGGDVPPPTEVKLDMNLIKLEEVNINEGRLRAIVWLKLQWSDKRLMWDESKYGNVSMVRVDAEKLWQPDVVLYSGKNTMHGTQGMPMALLYSDGLVYHLPQQEIDAYCDFDAYYFPYDEQVCKMKFGSWVYEGRVLDLTAPADTEDLLMEFRPHYEWSVRSTSAVRNSVQYPCCEERFVDVTFSFDLKRKSSMYTASFVAPIILLSLSLLFVFALPPVAREKMTLAIALLLGLLLFNYMHHVIVGAPSIVGNFLFFSIILALAVIGESAVVYNLYHSTVGVPKVVRRIFIDHLSRLVCVSPAKSGKYNVEMKAKDAEETEGDNRQADPEDWAVVAKVVDRLAFWIFLIIYVVGACVLLTARP